VPARIGKFRTKKSRQILIDLHHRVTQSLREAIEPLANSEIRRLTSNLWPDFRCLQRIER